MRTVEELEALVAEQEELLKDKADSGHLAAKYWGKVVHERKRATQLRGDVQKWQEMHRAANARADQAERFSNRHISHEDVFALAWWFADQGWSAHDLLGPIEKPWNFMDEARAARALLNAAADVDE